MANLGAFAFGQGDYMSASEVLRQALMLQPTLWKVQALLGICQKRLGNLTAAQTLLEKSFPHLQDPTVRTQAGEELIELFYQNGDVEKVVPVLPVLERLNPSNVDVLYIAYRTYTDLARHVADSIALIDPDSARTHQIMAQHLVNAGDLPGAIAQYRKALRIDARLSGAHYELGEAILLNSLSEPARDEAQKEFEAAFVLNPNDSKSETRLGQVYELRQDRTTALEYYSQAVKLNPNDVNAQVALGKTLMVMGQPEKGLEHLLQAVRLDPLNAVAHYRLSGVYRWLGRTSEADRELAKFHEITESEKRIRSVYQQMHELSAGPEFKDPDIPQ